MLKLTMHTAALALLLSPAGFLNASAMNPAGSPYLGIVYHEPKVAVIGLPNSTGGYLAWFVRVGPPFGLGVVGGFWSRGVVTLARAPFGNFIVATNNAATPIGKPTTPGIRIYTYNPRQDRILSSETLPGVQVAAGAPTPIQSAGKDRLWILGVAGRTVLLYCVSLHQGRIMGRCLVHGGDNGVLFWATKHGALVGVANHPGPGAAVGTLFFVRPNGLAHVVAIPKRMRGFPPLAAIRRGELCGVNASWEFFRSIVGKNGGLRLIVVKQLRINEKAVGRPGYYFSLGGGLAVVSALGDWNRRRFLHRYLFLISARTGRIERIAKIPPGDQPISATGGKIYCMAQNGVIAVFNSRLQLQENIDAAPRLFAIQGASSR